MKIKRIIGLLLSAAMLCSMAACGAKTDADVLMREAVSNADKLQSCTAVISNVLEFTANGKKNVYKTGNEIVYQAKPFALKSTQTSLLNAAAGSGVSYTVTNGDGVWFYSITGNKWQKTQAQSVDPSPSNQVDILRLLGSVSAQKYVRETTLNSKKVHKLELSFRSEVLRGTIENIVTATGMGQGSHTVVQTLLDSVPTVYGYCYIDQETGQILRIELDAAETLNRVFQNIDGSGVAVNITKCTITGDIANIGKAPAVALPPEATAAQTVQAAG